MLSATTQYKEEMNKHIRQRGYVAVSLGVVNQTAQGDAQSSDDLIYFSYGNVFENNNDYITYATLEQNYLKADGTFLFAPEDDGNAQFKINGITLPNVNDTFRIDFGQPYDIKGLTIDFGSGYPTELEIETNIGTETYSNTEEVFVTEDNFDGVEYFIIRPITMVGGLQRLHIRSILFGVGMVFKNPETENLSIEDYVSAISSDVSYKNVSISLFDKERKFDVDNDASFMGYLEPLQPIKISFGQELENGTVEWKQVASCYLKEWSSQSGKLSLTATDRLSQLENEYEHLTLTERSAYDEFELILADAGFEVDEYKIDDFLMAVTIKNPIERAPHRECLQMLANACRCAIYENEKGVLYIKANFSTVIDPSDLLLSSDNQAEWSSLTDIFTGTEYEYADLTTHSMQADGHTYFLPESGEQAYLDTGYVSESISDENGDFDENPYIDIVLPATYSYYGITVNWGGCIPLEAVIKTYQDDVLTNTFTFTDLTRTSLMVDDFGNFDKITVEVTKTLPFARAVINKVSFGSATDYRLTKDLMLENPIGYKEERVKEVKVKIYTYQLNADNEIELVEDDVYYTETLSTTGVTRTVENPLIHTQELAEELAIWVANYYRNNVSYSVKYRGDMRVQASDIITMDSDFKNNLQVEVETARLNFNGAFSGELDLRRALKMTNTTT